MMFVRIYAVLSVCVVVQGRAVFTAHVKNKCGMMIDEECTICFRFPRKKRYSPLLFRKKERIVGSDSYWFKVFMYFVKGQKRIHVWQFQWWKKYYSLNFLIFENTFYVQEDAVAPPKVELDTTVGPWWWLPEIGWAVIVTMQLKRWKPHFFAWSKKTASAAKQIIHM